ncbi:MAG: hypothetical protein WA736_14150 [Candidatus Acidiferrum sp.]
MALSFILLCIGSWALAQSISPGGGGGGGAPCSAFGTTSGTCAQGGVITGGGPTGGATTVPVITYNAAGQLTAVTTAPTGVTAVGTATVGQIPGTTTNDSASAGNVGEYVVSGANGANNLGTSGASVTVSIGANAVVTWTSNPYFNSGATGKGCASLVVFGGTPPTGLTATTVPYYVTCDATFTANAFHVSTSVANAIAGTTITTSGSDGGTTAGNIFSATSPNSYDFGGLSLTAGDWDVTGVGYFGAGATTSVTRYQAGIDSATGFGGTVYAIFKQRQAAEVPGADTQYPLSTERTLLSSTTTLFCSALSVFTISTMTIGGECHARRVR